MTCRARSVIVLCSLAYRDLRHYTQEDLPDSATAWRAWWRGAQSTFTVKTNAARIDNQWPRK